MSIVHFTRFRVSAEQEQHLLAARLASLRACHGSEPELRGAYLVRLGDNEWLDIAVWAGQPGAEIFDDPARAASRAVFFGQIEELLGEECGLLVEDAVPQPFSADPETQPTVRHQPSPGRVRRHGRDPSRRPGD